MNFGFLIFWLSLAFKCYSQVWCGIQICYPGTVCAYPGFCVSQFINNPNPFNYLQLAAPVPQIIQILSCPCPIEYFCLNGQRCVLNFSAMGAPQQRPTKPFKFGVLDKAACSYTRYYCHQNVLFICKNFDRFKVPGSEGYAVFMGIQDKQRFGQYFKLRQQILANNPQNNYTMTWDFHVIFVWKLGRGNSKIYDLDSRLQWGSSFVNQFNGAIKPRPGDPPITFRIIPCSKYTEFFGTNRMNELVKLPNGGFRMKHPPPSPDPIFNRYGQANTAGLYRNMTFNNLNYGVLATIDEFYRIFTN